jgi:glucose/arabinose dehydrogenase
MRMVVVVVAVLASVSSVRAGNPAPGYTDTAYVTGLSSPTAIAFLPDGRLLIAEKGGFSGAQDAALKLFDAGTTTTLGTVAVCAGSEMGLLGVAVDPGFATNGFIYLYRTESTGGCGSATGRSNEVVRVTMGGSSIGAPSVLLTGIRTDNGNHDGGVLRYNPVDGKLYVGVGDTGLGDNVGCPGSATNPYAQDLNALEGKILRLNLDGGVPADNPFFGQAGKRGEIFASGFRNPFRFGFDPVTGALWAGDVGDLAFEEIDIVTAGGDYAWPHCEGTRPNGCQEPGDVDPVFEYAHSASCSGVAPFLGSSITGGSFAGAAFGAEDGHYVFGDYTADNIYRLQPNAARDGVVGTAATIATAASGPVDVITGPEGAIYYVSLGSGQVRRMTAVGAPTTTTTAATTTVTTTTTTTSTTTRPPAPDELLGGRRLTLKAHAGTSSKRLLVLAKDAVTLGDGNGSADDPTLAGGSLRVRTTAGCGGPCDSLYPLAQSGWRRIGPAGTNKGYKFRSKTGPIRVVVVKTGRLLKAVGHGPLGHALAADPQPVDVALRLGARQYCLRFGGAVTFKPPSQFAAKDAPTSPGCP